MLEATTADILSRIGLSLALGLVVGMERQRAGKDVGLRTFALVSLAGCLGWLISPQIGFVVLIFVLGIMLILGSQGVIQREGLQITTSVALLVTAILGMLAAQGALLIAVAGGLLTTVLLEWRQELTGIAKRLTEPEVRSALMLAILSFVVYPALPPGFIDPWGIVNLRDTWFTVVLIAAVGFANYVLLKLYGARGLTISGLLGGVVNSTVTVATLAERKAANGGSLGSLPLRGIMLATAAMLVRNGVIITLLAPAAGLLVAAPLGAMVLVAALFALTQRGSEVSPPIQLVSPFSLPQVLQFGLIFLLITIASNLGVRALGSFGVYLVSLFGGFASSASAAATAATLASQGKVDTVTAAIGVLTACVASELVHLPLVWKASRDPVLMRVMIVATVAMLAAGAIAASVVFSLSTGL